MASNATHYNNLTPAKPLDKATLNKMVFRSLNLQASFNYERLPAGCTASCPVWKRSTAITRKT